MKTVELLGKNYTYPTNWDDVTISDYQRIRKYIDEFNDVEQVEADDLNDLLKQINLIAAYTNIPVQTLRKEKPSKLFNMINDLKFLSTDIPSKQVVEFVFKDKTYSVIQSLLNQEFQDYISLENLIQQDNLIAVLHLIVSVLSRERFDETLDDYDVHQRGELFKDLPITVANNIAVFFYQCAKSYSITSQLYSNPEELVETKLNELTICLNELDGKGWLTRLQVGIIRRYIKYIKPKWMKSLRSIVPKS